MKNILLLFSLLLVNQGNFSQNIPVLPLAISFGQAEVWGDSIYYFGGSNNYSGTELYHRVYKYNGSVWSFYDSIPFNHVWGFSTAIKGDSVFFFCGWPSGSNKLYMYRLSTKTWQQLASSPTNSGFSNYGQTLEYYNGNLYAFYNGYVLKYNIQTNIWSSGTYLSASGSWLATTIYNNEFYVAGWSLSTFYKYNPQTNQWTQLQNIPEFRGGGSFRAINNKLYYVGGYQTSGAGNYQNIYMYDPLTNQWSFAPFSLSSKRAYMADVLYKNKFYVIGGLNEFANPVNNVEYIIDQTTDVNEQEILTNHFELFQNYPNPFNPSTAIRYALPNESKVTITVYNLLGQQIKELVNDVQSAGYHETIFDATNLSSGVYLYKINAVDLIGKKDFSSTKKLLFLK